MVFSRPRAYALEINTFIPRMPTNEEISFSAQITWQKYMVKHETILAFVAYIRIDLLIALLKC